MRRFFRSYYLINVALLGSYLATRQLYLQNASQYGRLSGPDALLGWEWRVAGVLALAMGIHGMKVGALLARHTARGAHDLCLCPLLQAPSVDALVAEALMYGKFAVAFLAALSDWRLACYFLAASALTGALLTQPHYDGPHALVRLTPSAFLASVYDASKDLAAGGTPAGARKTYKAKEATTWLVALVDPTSQACTQIEPVLAKLSLKYTSEHLRFGALNIAVTPALAERLRISLNRISNSQVPSLVMFQGGVEVGRIPAVDPKTGKVGHALFRSMDVINGFTLGAVSAGNPFLPATAPPSVPAKPTNAPRKSSKKGR